MTDKPKARNDLANDLLADLGGVAENIPGVSVIGRGARGVQRVGTDAARAGLTQATEHAAHAARRAGYKGPAVETSFRITPLDWRKPSLKFGVQSASGWIGPIRAGIKFNIA